MVYKILDATRHTSFTNTNLKGTVSPNEGEIAKAVVWDVHDMLPWNQDNQEVFTVIMCLQMFT